MAKDIEERLAKLAPAKEVCRTRVALLNAFVGG